VTPGFAPAVIVTEPFGRRRSSSDWLGHNPGSRRRMNVSRGDEFWRWAGPVSFSIALGMLFGRLDFSLTQRGPLLDTVANVGSLWLGLAFLAGLLARSPKLAALGGVVALLAALFGFYDAMRLADQTGMHLTLHVARGWTAAALLCGPVYGVLGYLWRTRRSAPAVLALAAPFVMEPVAWLARIHPLAPRLSICIVESAAGVVMGWFLLKSGFLSARVETPNKQ
jgi:Family of unknown function (DUF6518)